MEKKNSMPGTLKLNFEDYCDRCDLFELDFYNDCPPEAGWDKMNYIECQHQDICRRMYRVLVKGESR